MPCAREDELVYIVCSTRPGVGKTLISRLVTEFALMQGKRALAFDTDPSENSLASYLPAQTVVASLADMHGQMALFDCLLGADGQAKIVDLGSDSYEPFFSVAQKIGFADEARRQHIRPVVLFVADASKRSVREYASLCRWLAPVVALHNGGVRNSDKAHALFEGSATFPHPLRIPKLTPLLNAIIDRHGFSFGGFLDRSANGETELHAWLSDIFREFSRLETTLLLGELWRSIRADLHASWNPE